MDGTAACVRCLKPVAEGGAFCGQCGAPAARPSPGGVPRATADMTTADSWQGRMPLCLGCGAIAPFEQNRCEFCQQAYESPRPFVSRPTDDTTWAIVQSSFECRACGHRSPINHLDVDGTVLCLSCGIEQRFEREQWWDALEHAHAVADGATEAFDEHQNFEDQQLELRAAPGQPLCGTCRSPLAVAAQDAEGLTMRCATCAKDRRYALPGKLSQRLSGLIGIVADEHEQGQKDAQLRDENGVSALRCPTCGAALSVTGASTIVTCGYCSNSCRVHPRALPKQSDGTGSALPFWLLFRGPSRARTKQLNEQRLAGEKATKREQQRENAQRSAEGQRAASDPKPKARRKRPVWVDGVIVASITAASLGLGVFINRYQDRRQGEEQDRIARAVRASYDKKRGELVEADAARKHAAIAARGTPYSFSVTMDVTKAEGQQVAVGEPCTIAVEGAADKIDHLLVQCQKAVLYDSMTQVAGMRMLAWETYGAEGGATPTGLRYSDTGQRSNGSEISLDTRLGQAAAWSQVVPIFRVELGPHSDKPRPKAKKPAAKP